MEEAVQQLCLPRTGVRDVLGRPVVEDGLGLICMSPTQASLQSRVQTAARRRGRHIARPAR